MTLPLPRPTDAELEILNVLWARGPSTVREVHDVLAARKQVGYTTALKFLQIMSEKGLVRRDDSRRAHVYEAILPREETRGQLVRDLLNRAFSGSAGRLVMHALSETRATPEEIAEIRQILDALEDGAP